jgi:hypothetical protein
VDQKRCKAEYYIHRSQRIDTHGLDDPKLKLHEYLREQIEKEVGKPNIRLDAFVVSVSTFWDLVRLYGQHHQR